MNDQNEVLSSKEYDMIGKALWELVKQYPCQSEDPDLTAEYDAFGSESSIAVFTLPGGHYKSHNVLGGYTAEIEFRVAYKNHDNTSLQRVDAQAYVGRIMSWLENTKDLPRLTDGRTITKITAKTVIPYKDETEKDMNTVYAVDAVMEYESD